MSAPGQKLPSPSVNDVRLTAQSRHRSSHRMSCKCRKTSFALAAIAIYSITSTGSVGGTIRVELEANRHAPARVDLNQRSAINWSYPVVWQVHRGLIMRKL